LMTTTQSATRSVVQQTRHGDESGVHLEDRGNAWEEEYEAEKSGLCRATTRACMQLLVDVDGRASATDGQRPVDGECWDLPTNRSHQTRRTHAQKKLSPKARIVPCLFSVYFSISRYKLFLTRPHVYIYTHGQTRT
jgi:hypothetical protein